MNVYQYIAIRNPMLAKEMVEHYGIRPNKKDLARQLAHVVAENGMPALEYLSEIHPDLPLFQQKLDELRAKDRKAIEENQKPNYFSATGNIEAQSTPKVIDQKTRSELLIIGGVLVLGLAVILRNS